MKAPTPGLPASGSSPEIHHRLQRYVFAIGITLIAFLLRYEVDPILPDRNKWAFSGFIIATTIVAWFGGFIPSLFTLFAGFSLANWYFVEPRHTWGFPANLALNLPPMAVGLTIVFFGRAMHLARSKANANAREANDHRARLELEVAERRRAEELVRSLNADLEARVRQRTADLVAINQELESFTYTVSHDLRAPLRHIDGYAQLLEEEHGAQLPPAALDCAGRIRKGSRNMGRLVDDLLELSRIGKKELTRGEVSLQTIVDEVIAEIKMETGNRSIEWQIGELPAANCDAGLVRQVFVNLVSNAVKYSGPREVARIEIGQTTLDGETVFFVRDNGVGFNMKYSSKLFGVFQRLHRATEFEGTGVGLATCARIVRKHGGRIWAEAALNEGATFFFTLQPPGVRTTVAPNEKLSPASTEREQHATA